MNNLDVLAIREFRRFANLYIYPETVYMLMTNIKRDFDSNQIHFEPTPQPIIKFDNNLFKDEYASVFIHKTHLILNTLFVEFFNNPQIVKMIRNKIYTEIHNADTKELLNTALNQIQSNDQQYTALLFNITILGENIYVYL